jgi:hypothetical protein
MDTLTAQATASINSGPAYPCEVTIEQDVEMVRSEYASKPDPKWTFTDERGHFHAFAQGGELPTLSRENVPVPCDGSCGGICEGYVAHRYTCLICGQEIEPHWIPDSIARTVGIPIERRKTATVVVYADRIIARTSDKVSIRVVADGLELIGIGAIDGLSGSMSSEDQWTETTIHAAFLEPRLSA